MSGDATERPCDEARALLREAADWIDHLSSGDSERDESEDFIARIRAFLEKTK